RDAFLALPQRVETLAQGLKKCSIRVQEADPRGGIFTVQVDLRIIEPERFGAALLYFTGSKDHNIRLRERALARGYSLNEYGLFPLRKGERGEQSDRPRRSKPVAAATEEEIYKALGLRWIPPELREDTGEIDAAEQGPFTLIERADIRAELHAHTTASDGALSIVELARAAKARGLRVIAVTDHSRSQPVAGGLDAETLRQHVEDVRQARSLVKGVRILAGSEVDILADGSLDYDDRTLSLLDIVVASPHSALSQPAAKATARLIRAIEHPCVDILGHPTGRLIGRREGLSPDVAAVAQAAREHGVALEVNAHWMRLDLRDAHVRLALEHGALIAVDCDVHREADFENLRFGLLTARRGWLDAGRCVNCFSERKLLAWLHRRRPSTAASRAAAGDARRRRGAAAKR
ncbi:MAG: PHP domain-containing protein, partial [Planctomycetota bacterium]